MSEEKAIIVLELMLEALELKDKDRIYSLNEKCTLLDEEYLRDKYPWETYQLFDSCRASCVMAVNMCSSIYSICVEDAEDKFYEFKKNLTAKSLK